MPKYDLDAPRWFQRVKYPAGKGVEVSQEAFDLWTLQDTHRKTNGRAGLAALVGDEVADNLQAAGFVDVAAVEAADDKSLLAVNKVGKATLAKLPRRTVAAVEPSEPTEVA